MQKSSYVVFKSPLSTAIEHIIGTPFVSASEAAATYSRGENINELRNPFRPGYASCRALAGLCARKRDTVPRRRMRECGGCGAGSSGYIFAQNKRQVFRHPIGHVGKPRKCCPSISNPVVEAVLFICFPPPPLVLCHHLCFPSMC